MPLEGLRAWIGEVERKLGARTRVMLVLAVIAIGAAGAAVYLAVDAHDTAVSESDLQTLQQRLEARIDQVSAGGGGATVTRLEAEVRALKAEVEALKGGTGKKGTATEGTGTPEAPVTKGSGTEGPVTKGAAPAGSVTEPPRAKAPATEGSANSKTGANGTTRK